MNASNWILNFHRRFKFACNLGFFSAIRYWFYKLRERAGVLSHPYRLTSKNSKHPLICRPGTSDIKVFIQIYDECEYRLLDTTKDVQLVIDCGANVGYSSAYFLTRFPEAKVIAIEPDPSNFSILRKNVESYGSRCETLHTAVWSHETDLVISDTSLELGMEWSWEVRQALPGEKAIMRSVSIAELLKKSGFDRISILKVDIEGAEVEVFSRGLQSWISKVDNLAIELHSNLAKEIFMKAISTEKFEILECGELLVCRRLL